MRERGREGGEKGLQQAWLRNTGPFGPLGQLGCKRLGRGALALLLWGVQGKLQQARRTLHPLVAIKPSWPRAHPIPT